MVKKARQLLHKAYIDAQGNEITLRLILLLNAAGLPRAMNHWLMSIEDRKLRKDPSDDMLRSRKFYAENRARVDAVRDMLADEMSKDVLGGGTAVPYDEDPSSPGTLSGKNTVLC